MKSDTPELRRLRLDDLPRCVELSTEAGWNQTAADWRFFLGHADCLGIELPAHGLVATTVRWELDGGISWIGMVLVTTACRGRGYARTLLDSCLRESALRGLGVMLDATDLGAKVYSRMNFDGDECLVRMRREAATTRNSGTMVQRSERNGMVAPLSLPDLPEIADLDQSVLGAARRTLLDDLIRRESAMGWLVRGESGDVEASVIAREGRTARHIGPLVARSSDLARDLAMCCFDGYAEPVVIDVPEGQAEWLRTLRDLDFRPERRFLRMGWRGVRMKTDWSRYFAMAGPEFA